VTLDNLKKVVKTDAKNRFDLILENEAGEKVPVDLETSSSPETVVDAPTGIWWIKANQGHSIKVCFVVSPFLPFVTNRRLWNWNLNLFIPSPTSRPESLFTERQERLGNPSVCLYDIAQRLLTNCSPETQGLSKMKRNHIHLAQGVSGSGVISGQSKRFPSSTLLNTLHNIGMRNSSQVYIYVDVGKALGAGLTFSLSNNGVVLTDGNGEGFLLPEFFSRVQDNKGHALPGWEGSESKDS